VIVEFLSHTCTRAQCVDEQRVNCTLKVSAAPIDLVMYLRMALDKEHRPHFLRIVMADFQDNMFVQVFIYLCWKHVHCVRSF
jgi:hypothetical protein